ncbi:alpha/beta fold hydrolase [Salimicrobium humidisoli]|uniref:Alpha/beta hydrolase n=1 Tax=Salimicrobium humidisoli TaxID=2029857 RepID=A0ABX4HSX4_9BACI|nr:alpha/beta hydrolase [Salimicrobium humidisoli]PBB05800.1 alpha/beta hydrolase [Salimicrobium humidisoli]
MKMRKRNNVQIYGNGTTPIIFAHGFGCDQHIWEYVIPGFFDTYQVILFDYAGSGNSSAGSYSEERYSSIDGYAKDVIGIMEEMALTDAIFVGHSFSGMVGLKIALERPELLRSNIMLGASPRFLNEDGYQGGLEEEELEKLLQLMESDYRKWARYMAELFLEEMDAPKMKEELEEMLADQSPEITRSFAEVAFTLDMREELKENTVPSLLLQSKEDSLVPPAAGEYLREHLPYSESVVLDAKGHAPHLSHPQEVTALIMDYIEQRLWKSS